MSTLLIRHAECAASFDDARRELRGASVLVSDQLIEAIGPAAELPATARPERGSWWPSKGGRTSRSSRQTPGTPGCRPPNSDTPVDLPFSSV